MKSIEWLIEQIKFTNKEVYNELHHQFEQAKKMYEEELRKENLKGYAEGIESGSRYYPD